MKLNRGWKILCLILFVLISISAISAADNNTQIITQDNNIDDNILSIDDSNDDILEAANDGSFSDLNTTINSGSSLSIQLNKNYTYTSSDSALKNGIVINKNNMVIDGQGNTIDAKGNSRIFYVNSTNVTIKNINFVNGKASGFGAAIYNYGEALKIEKCSFENNALTLAKGTATNYTNNSTYEYYYSYGGAVYSYIASATAIVDSTFKSNSANIGGAIGMRSVEGARHYVINCTFINNSAAEEGGAISGFGDWGSYETIRGCTFINNTAKVASAITQIESSIVNVTNCIFLNQSGYIMDSFSRNFVANNNWWGNTINNKAVKPNVTSYIQVDNWLYYDLIVNLESSSATVSINNLYDSQTGQTGIYATHSLPSIQAKVKSVNATLSSNDFVLDNSGQALVKYNILGDCTLTANIGNIAVSKKFKSGSFRELQTLIDNSDGPVIKLDKDYTYTIGVDNSDTGILISNGNLIIDGNGHFVNAAGNSRVFNVNANNVTFKNIRISNGNATLSDGGGILTTGRFGQFINCTFVNNTADNDGGGAIYVGGAYNSIINCTFIDNSNIYRDGGAVYCYSNNLIIRDSLFKNNYANKDGGALAFIYTATISNCTFINNTAWREGGAIYDSNYNDTVAATIDKCTFIANNVVSSEQGGGAIYTQHIDITNSMFMENNATYGSAVYGLTNSSSIDKCIFINNTGVTGLIFWVYGGTVENSVFLNNNVFNIIDNPYAGVFADYNWYGNTGNNYKFEPAVSSLADMSKWLYLNITNAVYNENDDTYKFQFNFMVWDSANNNSVNYDFNNLPLLDFKLSVDNLTTSENLTINNTSISLGKDINTNVKFYKGNIIAEYENVKYTIPYKFQKKSWVEANSTINVELGKSIYSDIYIRPFENDYFPFLKDRITYTIGNTSIAKINRTTSKITGLKIGVTNLTIRYNGLTAIGLDQYTPSSKTITINVTRISSEISLVYDLSSVQVGDKNLVITSTNPYIPGAEFTFSSNNTNVAYVDENKYLNAVHEGTAKITIYFAGTEKYAPTSTSFIVKVTKKDSKITLYVDRNIEMNKSSFYYVGAYLNPVSCISQLRYISNDTRVATASDDGKINGVGGGVAKITVKFDGNDEYNPTSEDIIVTVYDYETHIDVSPTMTVNVTDSLSINALIKDYMNNTIIAPAKIHYTSNDTTVLSIDESGHMSGIKEGKAKVTIVYDGHEKYLPSQATVIVDVVTLPTNIIANPTVIYVDQYTKINASLNYSGTFKFEYASDNVDVVTINQNGYLTGKKVGSANITIKYNGNQKFLPSSTVVKVTVERIPTTIEVGKTFSLLIGETEQLNAKLNPNIYAKLDYSSSNESVVTVDQNGLINAIAEGSALITITYDGDEKHTNDSQIVMVNIYKENIPTNIASEKNFNLIVGNKTNIGAVLSPSNAGKLNYTTNDSNVATVDENGVITAIGEGKALITITLNKTSDKFQDVSETVTVNVSPIPTDINADASLTVNLTENATLKYSFSHPEAGDLEFVIANPNIISLSNGVVTGKSLGSTTITINFSGNKQYAPSQKIINVNVVDVPVAIDVVDSISINVTAGGYVIAKLLPKEAESVVYSSSNTNIVTVNSTTGQIKGIKTGEADITVKFIAHGKYRGNETKVHVRVVDVPVEIDVVDSIKVNVTESAYIGAKLNPSRAGELTYSSFNTDIVTVNKTTGKITGISAGEAYITVSFAGNGVYRQNSVNVLVTVTKVKTEIYVSKTTVSLVVDDNVNINATLNPSKAGSLKYSSSNPSVVSVDDKGQITALKTGSANITVSFTGHDKYASSQKVVTVTVSRIPTTITINNNLSMEIGSGFTIRPILSPASGNLTYSSNNSDVVEISDSGFIFSNGYGSALITIKYAGNEKYMPSNASMIITVSPRITSIDVDSEITIGYGDSMNLGAKLNGPIDGVLKYSTSNSKIVSIDGNGVIKAVSKGTATITISYAGNNVYYPSNATVKVIVEAMTTNITVVNQISLSVDDQYTLDAKLNKPSNGKLTYKSSNNSIATVDANGKITAVGQGSAIITVSYAGNSDYRASSANVTVSVSKVLTSIKANNTFSFKIDDVVDLGAKVTPGGGKITYSSNNPDVATVDSNGKVTGISEGSAVITLNYAGDNKYEHSQKMVTVSVSRIPTSINLNPITMYVGDEYTVKNVLTPVSNGKLTYEIDLWTVADVDSKGVITAIEEGSAELTVFYNGNDKYLPSNATVKVTVIKKSISPLNYKFATSVVDEKGQATFKITLPEYADGNFVVEINGEAYSESIENGVATIVVDGLKPGDYKVSMRYTGNEVYSSITNNTQIHISKLKIDKNKDKSVLYTTAVKYTVHLTKDTQAMQGKTITFVINGKKIYAKTNKLGYASISIKLPPKTYTITAQYGGVKVKNKITVKSIVVAKNVNVKKSAKSVKIKVSLKKVNKKFLKGKKLTLKFNGKKFTAKTNKKGVATFTIKKSVYNKLKVGKKYTYKVTYLKNTVSKKITIKK